MTVRARPSWLALPGGAAGRAALAVCLAVGVLVAGHALPARASDAAVGIDGLAAVRARGELLWGADAHGGAPYVFQDATDPDRTIGFEVELMDAVARHLGVRARLVQGPWDKLLELLARGSFDVAVNGLEESDDKRSVARLTRPYAIAPQRLTVRRDDPRAPSSLLDVQDRKIGCLPGSLAERVLRARGADARSYDTQDDIYQDVVLGRTDGAVADEAIALYYGDVEPRLVTLPADLGTLRYVMAVRRDDTALHTALDDAIVALAQDGTLRAIYERWGLWNQETAALLGDPDPTPRTPATALLLWQQAVGEKPPFWTRVRERYPAMMPLFAHGALLTLAVSLLAMLLAVGLGLLLAAARAFGPRPLRWLSVVYVEIFRGTPLLVQLTMIYFGLPELGVTLSPFAAGVLALGLNYAAAESENYRAGLLSVPTAQLDAARALGLSTAQAARHVLMPQAARVALPPMTNDFIALLKDSSLVSVVALTELTKVYGVLGNSTRDHLGLGVVVGLWYLLVGLPFVWLARRVEQHLSPDRRRGAQP
jgi:polar amino acid transport system substrate-binding protein